MSDAGHDRRPGVSATRYRGRVIDCDVHHGWATPDDLLPYLPAAWREFVTRPARTSHGKVKPLAYVNPQIWPNPTGSGYRPDSYPDAGAPGSSYELMKLQLLEPNRTERALLKYEDGGYVGSLANPHLAVEIARATNDWSIDTWLSQGDQRLYSGVVVATQQPEAAAAEIRRVGEHAQIAEVLLVSSGLGQPFGHPCYDPIHRAAAELGLPIAIHAFGDVIPGHNVSPIGGGMPSFYFELMTLSVQSMMTHATSFISHGVFEKYPDLRLMLVESGIGWLPGFLLRADSTYRALRCEVPWLRRRPSEYFRDHIRITTQPLEEVSRTRDLVDLLALCDAEDLLCFSTDYPHWDTDEVDHVSSVLPRQWWPKVFHDNAEQFFGWGAKPTRNSA